MQIQWNLHITDSFGPTFSVCLEMSVVQLEVSIIEISITVEKILLFRVSVSRGSTVIKKNHANSTIACIPKTILQYTINYLLNSTDNFIFRL